MPITLRPLDLDTDLPRIAALYAPHELVPVTADDLRERFRPVEGSIRRRVVAVDDSGTPVGISICTTEVTWPPRSTT